MATQFGSSGPRTSSVGSHRPSSSPWAICPGVRLSTVRGEPSCRTCQLIEASNAMRKAGRQETRAVRARTGYQTPSFSSFSAFLIRFRKRSVNLVADAGPDPRNLVAAVRLAQFHAHARNQAGRQLFVGLDLHFHGRLALGFEI